MSRYIVRIVGPAGRETYLRHGREVESQDNATHYSSPSAAHYACCRYFDKHPRAKFVIDVMDTRDPERRV